MSWVESIGKALTDWLTSADVLRAASAELRTLMPIARLGDRVIVSRHDDVLEVLQNSDAFGVADIYASKMDRTTGSFFLGMEATAQYRREATIARRAVADGDPARIAEITASAANELLTLAKGAGAIDAVAAFSRLIPMRLLGSYFGTPGPDTATMQRWMRDIFWDIFLNPSDDREVRERASSASAELAPYLDELIAGRQRALESDRPVPDDFVTRLLRQQRADPSIDRDLIRRNLGGIIVGAVDTQSKAIAHSLDQLLRSPAAFDAARRAALSDDDATVAAHVWEALRFNPHNPILLRRCIADTVLARGTDREAEIAQGTTVVAFTLSAMFDPAVVEEPEEFSARRPLSAYLHFGHGQHSCFGERINRVVVPLAIKALLGLESLRYADSGTGAIAYEGPFPDHMPLAFDVAR